MCPPSGAPHEHASNLEGKSFSLSPSEQLLKTKLLIPPPPRGICARPKLVQMIEEGLRANHRLILLNAAAGFGKTTLLTEWVHETQLKVAWLSLDDGDNDITRFATYLMGALGASLAQAEFANSAFKKPIEAFDLKTALTYAINAVAGTSKDIALVLDDYHLIQSSDIHAAVEFLLENLPQNMHLVIATRHSPPLPLVQLRARVQVTEIGEDELKFSLEDARTYLNQIRNLQLSKQELRALCDRTEGWIAGIQMAALSLRDRQDKSDFIQKLSGTHRYILDYLLEEVLDEQPSVLQDFMLRTSILSTLSASVCLTLHDEDELHDLQVWAEQAGFSSETNYQVLQEALEYLDRANLFIIPLDDERQWFRYHSLYADLLMDRLKYLHPDRVSTLHRKAGRWYEAHGHLDEAVGHILESGDYERAAKLLARNAIEMVFRGNLLNLTRWFDMLPEESRKPLPWLSISHAWTSMFVGELNPVANLVREAESSMEALHEAHEIQRVSGIIEVLRGYLAAMRGSMSLAVEFAKEALLLLPREDLALRGFAAMFLASVLHWTGELDAASEAYQEAININRKADEMNLLVETLCELAALVEDQGKLHQSAELCREALSYFPTEGTEAVLPAHGCAWIQLSLLQCEWNRLESAREYAERALDICQEWGQAEFLMRAHLAYARVLLALGEFDSANGEIERAVHVAKTLSPWYVRRAETWRVRLQLAQDKSQAALRWIREYMPDLESEPDYQDLPIHILAWRVMVEAVDPRTAGQDGQDQLENALEILEHLSKLVESTGARRFQIEILLLKSLALDKRGDRDQARSILVEALSTAQPEGYIRTFLERGRRIRPLLKGVAIQGPTEAFVKRLLELLDRGSYDEGQLPAKSDGGLAPLSPRELQVLRLLAAHLTSRDIAEELTISTSTVRSHMKNIYRKLDVHSRRQAVERAQDIGLLP
jgi:LuxR family maltose regulon positive regulatory protein